MNEHYFLQQVLFQLFFHCGYFYGAIYFFMSLLFCHYGYVALSRACEHHTPSPALTPPLKLHLLLDSPDEEGINTAHSHNSNAHKLTGDAIVSSGGSCQSESMKTLSLGPSVSTKYGILNQ